MEAQASTTDRPLEGFIPRSGAGLPFGILGVSSTQPPDKPHTRIDFQFSRAAFKSSKIPFQVPYPVPFRLLGDERKVKGCHRVGGGWVRQHRGLSRWGLPGVAIAQRQAASLLMATLPLPVLPQGWIDTTYLARDGRLRIARGNKGTVFILAKDDPPAS